MPLTVETIEQAQLNESEYDAYMEGSDVYEKMIYDEKGRIITEKIHDDFDCSIKKRNLRVKKWKQKNPEKCREYTRRSYQKSREKYKNGVKDRKFLKRTSDTGFNREQWKALLETYNFRCAYCGILGKDTPQGYLSRDHVVSRNKGGKHSPHNIVPACVSCNSSKGDRDGWTPKIYIEEKATSFLPSDTGEVGGHSSPLPHPFN